MQPWRSGSWWTCAEVKKIHKRKLWTKREMDSLNKLWNEPQVSRQNLMDLFGKSWDAISGKARAMGLPSRASIETAINEELLIKLMKVVDG